MYGSAFCRVYNELGWNVYPEVLAGQLLDYLRARGKEPRRMLDMGCGTGVLCQKLAEAGMEVHGIDLSEHMIALARQRAPELDFQTADMTEFSALQGLDLITCTGDALNHVFEPEDILRVMANAARMLAPGGLFIFDLLNEREVPGGAPFDLDYSDTLRARFETTREAEGIVNLNVRVFEGGAPAFEEHIRERLHDPGWIREALKQSGFRVERFADRLLDEGPHGATWFVVARRLWIERGDKLSRSPAQAGPGVL